MNYIIITLFANIILVKVIKAVFPISGFYRFYTGEVILYALFYFEIFFLLNRKIKYYVKLGLAVLIFIISVFVVDFTFDVLFEILKITIGFYWEIFSMTVVFLPLVMVVNKLNIKFSN